MQAETAWDQILELASLAVYGKDGRGMVGRYNRDQLLNRVARALIEHERRVRDLQKTPA